MELLGVIQVLPLVEVFYVGVWGSLLELSLRFLTFRLALVAEFYGVIYALEEAQKWGLTNVWLECDFVLVCVAFTARTQMFLGCFVIDGILVLITVEKSSLGLLIFFVKGMRVLISWLI